MEENFYRVMLDSIAEGLIAIDDEGKIIFINKVARQILNVDDDVIGKFVADVIPNTRMHVVLQTGRAEHDQIQHLGDKSIVTTRVPIVDDSGKILGVVAVFRDISRAWKMAEKVTNVRELEALLMAIFDSTYDAISVADEEGRIILVNRAYTRITGLSARDVIGKPATIDIAEGESMHIKVARERKPVRNVRMLAGPGRKEVIVNVDPIFVNGVFRGSVAVVHDTSEIMELHRELEELRRTVRRMVAKYTFDDIVAVSHSMKVAVDQAKRVADTNATVLLRGESGTGKELFAHAIHNASKRKNGPFVSVNCAAIPDSLLESELFGYEEGAFTGAKKGGKKGLIEEADGGTLFLDEVGKLSMNVQSKFLRFLQDKEFVRVGGNTPVYVNVRVIAATNRNLEEMVERGEFLPDLYYRLNVVPIYIPPLRNRKQDIPYLVDRIIKKLNQEYGRIVESISPQALEILMNYDWPGNIRELENVIGRAIINMDIDERRIEAHHIGILSEEQRSFPTMPRGRGLKEMLEEYEKAIIKNVLDKCEGSREKAARELGISLRTLYYKLRKYGLE